MRKHTTVRLNPFTMVIPFRVCVMVLLILLTKSSLILADVTSPKASTRPEHVWEGRIYGGETAEPNSHPYMVLIRRRVLWMTYRKCSGSILGFRWIVSAAHCINDFWLFDIFPLDALLGIHDVGAIDYQTQIVKISQKYPHPDYKGGIDPNDIAMLKTDRQIIYNIRVRPIRLPFSGLFLPKHMKITGWGLIRDNNIFEQGPHHLQEAHVTYVPFDECHKEIEKYIRVDEVNPITKHNHLCTGPLGGDVGACTGDSGGPLVGYYPIDQGVATTESIVIVTGRSQNGTKSSRYTRIDNDTLYEYDRLGRAIRQPRRVGFLPVLIGIISYGITPCGEFGAPTLYANVSHHREFIDHTMTDS